MFTGLIEATGRIEAFERSEAGGRLRLGTALAGALRPGDSLAVNGVCLTVTTQTTDSLTADLAPVTMAVTTLGAATPGRLVNLERPVRADDRMGGHFVLGHVDGTAPIRAFTADGDSYWLEIALPSDIAPLVVRKGSIAVDGISLTVAELAADAFAVQIVPFTRAHTALSEARAGDLVNLEADVLGKYVARLLEGRPSQASTSDPLVTPPPLARTFAGDPS